MKEPKQAPTFTLIHRGRRWTIRPHFATYGNGALAVILLDARTGEEFCTLSVNMPEASDTLPDGVFYAKGWSENDGIPEELEAMGWISPAPGIPEARSGWVTAKAYRWNADGAPPPRPAPPAFDERDCGGAFDGHTVTSDADPGL